jgi:hypothetical protein
MFVAGLGEPTMPAGGLVDTNLDWHSAGPLEVRLCVPQAAVPR